MKVWEMIQFLSQRPAGENVVVRLDGHHDIPVVDAVQVTSDDDGAGESWVVVVGDDPSRNDWQPPTR